MSLHARGATNGSSRQCDRRASGQGPHVGGDDNPRDLASPTAREFAIVAFGLLFGASAHAQSFGAKPGAWENTVTVAEVAVPPPDILADMAPDDRALIEKQVQANEGRPQVRTACVTQESLEHGFMPQANPTCSMRIVSRTATKLVATTFCQEPLASNGTMTWEARSPESVVGSIDQEGGGRNVHIRVASRWLGPSCAAASPLANRKADRPDPPASTGASAVR